MNKSRLEAFSDGVLAIIITIMILELKIPEGTSLQALKPLWPALCSYILSFVFIGIYWVNHHHLLHTVKRVNGAIMWANLFLLFCLSLVPFVTGWMGASNFDKITVAAYGALLLFCGVAFTILANAIKKTYTKETGITLALAKSKPKTTLSTLLYMVSIPTALYISPLLSALLFATVSVMWIVPSKAIEQALAEQDEK